MAEHGTLDLLARNPDSRSVLTLAYAPVHHGFGRLTGELLTWSDEFGDFAVQVEAHLELEEDDLRAEESEAGGLRILDSDGHQLGGEIRNYQRHEALGGRYEIHSGVVGGETDVFAVSDPIELALAGLLIAGCTLRTVLNHYQMHEIAQIYRERGRIPKFRVKSGLKGMLKCDIEWEVEAGD